MLCVIENKDYEIRVDVLQNRASIEGGFFGDVLLDASKLFDMRLKNIRTGENSFITSESSWETVGVTKRANTTEFCFKNPEDFCDIQVFVEANRQKSGVKWSIEVINDNEDISVMELSYPTPVMSGEHLSYFMPVEAGVVFEDVSDRDYYLEKNYPSHTISMQYFAVYGKKSGIYIGFEDGRAATKRFRIGCKSGVCTLGADFFGIGASNPSNSFKAFGYCNWQFFEGDWYDASMIYSDFVRCEAEWLPEISEDGRPDTADRFKEVPFWVCDYIPNSKTQGDNKPMKLSAGSDIYEPDYWYKAPIQLQKELGVPIAYHVYNWHEIPFNIEYPHFLPAKKVFTEHVQELRDNNIYVLPYINAVSWEMHDAEMGHRVNFENTGYKEGMVKEDGSFVIQDYPQKTVSGKTSGLVPICGSSSVWHKMMEELTEELESTIPVDGIYFDQVAAFKGAPCYNHAHSHLPGGGNHWAEGYNRMMKKINANKPEGHFYFSECNNEAFMKSFDGFLTWSWVHGDEVPAFAAVYAGYIQMLGRCTLGEKKDDFDFFKYCTAKSLLYGQQLGWCKADLIYSGKHMEFLKNAVAVRYKYSELFNCSKMLRPPVVVSDMPKLVTKPGLWFEGDIVSDYVLGSAWQYRNGTKTVVFAMNISEGEAVYKLSFNAKEYGVINKVLPADFVLNGDECIVEGRLGRYEIKIWEIDNV